MNIGRNDPCPCGSGIKFKRCCMSKTTPPMDAIAPSSRSSKYKMMRACHWTQDEIGEMTTEDIIDTLEQWGVRFKHDAFLKDVQACCGSYDIYEQWKKRFVMTAEGFDQDFIWMACEILWERLAPNKLSTEQLDDMMQRGYDFTEKRNDKAACEMWLKVWDALTPRFTDKMRSIEDADPVFRGMQSLFNWCQDLELELGNAGRHDNTFHNHRIRYCREFCKFFPETGSGIINHMKTAVAESVFLSGSKEEGDKEFQKVVDEYPDDLWVYVTWGDMYSGFRGGIVDAKRAEELYRKALGMDKQEDKTILERIEGLKRSKAK